MIARALLIATLVPSDLAAVGVTARSTTLSARLLWVALPELLRGH